MDKIPITESGQPEAGLQSSMLDDVPAKEIRPKGNGKVVQINMLDYLKLESLKEDK